MIMVKHCTTANAALRPLRKLARTHELINASTGLRPNHLNTPRAQKFTVS